jgi:FkbM family methyltransferase
MMNTVRIAREHYKQDGLLKFVFRLLRALIGEYTEFVKWIKTKLFYLIHGNDYVTRNIQGNKMNLSLLDKGISRGLIAHGYWEPLATKILNDTVRPGDVVVDIGANMGYFALQEARLVGPAGKVFAIEPVSTNIELLRKNIEQNNFTNIEVHQYAVGDKVDDTSSIFLSHKLNCGSMICRQNLNVIDGEVKKLPVKQITLDSFLQDRLTPVFIRMDTEGYEYEILMGMQNLLAGKTPLKLLIELHPGYLGEEKFDKLMRMMKGHGFRCEIAADRELDSKSKILQKIYYWLCDQLYTDSRNGFLLANADLDELKVFKGRTIYPHVLFARG